MSLFEKLAHIIGDRKIPVPAMPGIPRYRVSFANRHVVKIIFLTVLVAAAAVGTGMYFTIRDVVSATYNWPTPATYDVTEDGLQKMGQKILSTRTAPSHRPYPSGLLMGSVSLRSGSKTLTWVALITPRLSTYRRTPRQSLERKPISGWGT